MEILSRWVFEDATGTLSRPNPMSSGLSVGTKVCGSRNSSAVAT